MIDIPASSGAKAVKVLAEYINLPQYLRTKWRGVLKGKHTYEGNTRHREGSIDRFWYDVENNGIKPNDVVLLKNAILTEWFPRAPGAHVGWQSGNAAKRKRLFTRGGEPLISDPQETKEYWSEELPPSTSTGGPSKDVQPSPVDRPLFGKFHEETHVFNGSEEFLVLEPSRKTFVVLSGFGNLRFSVKPEGRLLSAVGHSPYDECPNTLEGIPVLVRPQRYDKLSDCIRKSVVVDIEGVYAKLPRDIDNSLWRVKGIPRYCLIVDSQMQIKIKSEYSGPLACYAWTLFEYPGDQAAEYAFAYAPFDGSKPETIAVATDFIERYLRKYRGSPITDFDEEVPRLDAQVKLGDLMNDKIDFAKLDRKMTAIKASVDQHEAQMLLMAIRGAGTSFVAG